MKHECSRLEQNACQNRMLLFVIKKNQKMKNFDLIVLPSRYDMKSQIKVQILNILYQVNPN